MISNSRPRLTAGLLELLTFQEDVPRHSILTAYAKHLTGGFLLTDAADLEVLEGHIPAEIWGEISRRGPLTSLRNIFQDNDCQFHF
jgi:hypothetical protein